MLALFWSLTNTSKKRELVRPPPSPKRPRGVKICIFTEADNVVICLYQNFHLIFQQPPSRRRPQQHLHKKAASRTC